MYNNNNNSVGMSSKHIDVRNQNVSNLWCLEEYYKITKCLICNGTLACKTDIARVLAEMDQLSHKTIINCIRQTILIFCVFRVLNVI